MPDVHRIPGACQWARLLTLPYLSRLLTLPVMIKRDAIVMFVVGITMRTLVSRAPPRTRPGGRRQ